MDWRALDSQEAEIKWMVKGMRWQSSSLVYTNAHDICSQLASAQCFSISFGHTRQFSSLSSRL